MGFFYRYEDETTVCHFDIYYELVEYRTQHLRLHFFPIKSVTPKGVWIDDQGRKRFILVGARKRYACPTIVEALESFVARKKRQLGILQTQVNNVEFYLKLAEQEHERQESGMAQASG
jgi:hypothetical protein